MICCSAFKLARSSRTKRTFGRRACTSASHHCDRPVRSLSPQAGLTLVEVLVAMAIACVAIAGVVAGYLFSAASAQRSALSLAANGRAVERIEETRSAKWDLSSWPTVDQLASTNFPDQVVVLDHDSTGQRPVYATNITRITQISVNPPVKQIRVDCIWNFRDVQLLTNSVETCRAPDQ
jgi:prepilin-type N-terminal cleavage/methylation domain-containing protein